MNSADIIQTTARQSAIQTAQPSTAKLAEQKLSSLDAKKLAERLRQSVRGEVRFDNTSRALYATDASNYRQIPIGVILPRDADDVIAAMAICREFDAPVLARGGGTSLCGQCCNVAVVFDLSKYMNQIIDLDPAAKIARVQPGVVLDDLRNAAEKFYLTFAPDPSTHTHNTLGGMIGNNSCGTHSVMGGRTSDNIIELDILTYEGVRLRVGTTSDEQFEKIIAQGGAVADIYSRLRQLRDTYAVEIRRRFPDIPRRISGFNLIDLLPENQFNIARALVGSEGTCCMVLEASVRLVDSPPHRTLVALGYPDVFEAADHVPQIMRADPIALEGVDDKLIEDMKMVGLHPQDTQLLPDGSGWLLVEFGGATREEADKNALTMMAALKTKHNAPTMKLFDDKDEENKIWEVRKAGLGATAHVPNKEITWEGWEDSAVPPEKLGDYLRELRALLEKYHYSGDFYGHFGQGCLHTRIDFDLETQEGIAIYKRFMDEATDLVVKYGGSFSGEHGDGQSKAQFLGKIYGKHLLQAFREFKSIFDPRWKMNPGKIIDPYHIDENLRIGTEYNPWVPQTHFHYPDDEGNFSRAVLRCVGVGECRKHDKGTMCPSYMATREEMHSTRGRSRLLFEMLQGEVVTGKWRDEGVKESLDLCLSCKACRHECPVSVDMATYKAEFFSHYYHHRLRPPHAYAFGLIDMWARFGAYMPELANALTQSPPLAWAIKRIFRIAPEREIPALSTTSFKQWFFTDSEKSNRAAGVDSKNSRSVILWADTFNNYFYAGTARAAVEVLQAAGFTVHVPQATLCCGRPLYEFGMLDRAKQLLLSTFHALDEPLRAGIPIVVLEPACASVFRVESRALLPFHEQSKRLAQQTYLLAEFLNKYAPEFKPPLKKNIVLHGHCHHHAHNELGDTQQFLSNCGAHFDKLDAGCCGMAGSFGFEDHKYAISQKLGERALLPAVRSAPRDTLIVSDGFSCREQIRQSGGRRALHLADALLGALHS